MGQDPQSGLQNVASRCLWRSLDLSSTDSLALTFSCRCTLGTVEIVLPYSGFSLAPLRTVCFLRFPRQIDVLFGHYLIDFQDANSGIQIVDPGRRRPARRPAPRRERALWHDRHWNRRARPLARGGRFGAGPAARPPRVVAGILARIADPFPRHAQHGRATAVTPLALGHIGHG